MRKNPVFDTQIFLFLAHFLLHDEVNDGCYDQSKDDDLDVFCVFADLLIQLIFGHDGVQIPAHSSQHAVPSTSTDGREEDELTIVHASQSGRDGYQVTDHWDKAPRQCGCYTMIIEILLALFHLFLIQQTHLAPFAVGKLIDDRATYIEGNEVVDAGTDICTEGGKEDDQKHIE